LPETSLPDVILGKIIDNFEIPEDKTEIIYNPIDSKKFNIKKEVLIMKTKKYFVYALISLFVLFPFLNVEGVAISPLRKTNPSPSPAYSVSPRIRSVKTQIA
jgi:hypothetical protein